MFQDNNTPQPDSKPGRTKPLALYDPTVIHRFIDEHLHEGIWIIDSDALTTYINPRMAALLGYTVDEIVGQSLFAFMDEQGAADCEHNLARRQQGIQEQHDFEFLRKDGTRIHTLLAAVPILDEAGT